MPADSNRVQPHISAGGSTAASFVLREAIGIGLSVLANLSRNMMLN